MSAFASAAARKQVVFVQVSLEKPIAMEQQTAKAAAHVMRNATVLSFNGLRHRHKRLQNRLYHMGYQNMSGATSRGGQMLEHYSCKPTKSQGPNKSG